MPREALKIGAVATALSSDPRMAPVLSRKAGFAGLQFEAISPAVDLPGLSISGLREFRRLLTAQDQQLIGLRSELGPKGFGIGADIDRELSQLKRVMEAAKGLASPLVCVDIGPLPTPASIEPPPPPVTPGMAGLILLPNVPLIAVPVRPTEPPPDPATVSLVDSALAELGQLTDRIGTVLAFRSELSTFSAMERAIRKADCPWFGVDLDPAAVLGDAWSLDTVFSRLGPFIRHVRGRDALAGGGHRTKPAVMGQGSTDWGHLLSNLDDVGYAGWITIDPLELPDRASGASSGLKEFRRFVRVV